MSNKVFGYACAQTQMNNGYAVWCAILEDGILTLHDISGLLGTRKGKPNDFFFPCEEGKVHCAIALEKANQKIRELVVMPRKEK